MGEQVADVGQRGDVARDPQTVAEGRAMSRPMTVNEAWAKVIQRREDLARGSKPE